MAIVFVGLLSKRTPALAAATAAIAGVLFYAIITFGWKNRIAFAVGNNIVDLELHWLHVAGLNFALMMTVMAGFRLFAPLPTAYEQVDTKQVDITPWSFAKAGGALIVLGVVGIYATLWMASR
jgi:SSS family solute:Na+ symporter